MNEFIGTNIWWDFYGKNLEDPGTTDINTLNNSLQGFFQNLDAVGFVREFHNWYLHEGIEASCPNANLCYTYTPEQPSPSYAEGVKFKFKTAYQGQASCINFDYFYELMLQHMNSNFCLTTSGSATTVIEDFVAEPICGFTSAQERIPVNSANPSDFLNPQKYKELATYLYNLAYRYGDDASTPTASPANIMGNLAAESQTSFVNNPAIRSVTSAPLKYMCIWNEPDKWWLEGSVPHAYIKPEEYAALLSAAADGHQGQVNHQNLYTLGIKNADSNMKIVVGGIAELDPCYFQTMADWLDQNRTGANKFPFDVFNYHHYSQAVTANYQISQFCAPISADQLNAWTYGVSPEEDNLKEKLITLRQTMIDKGNTFNQDWSTKEFWITEYGYDTHPASVQAAIPENNPISGLNDLRSLVPFNYRPNWNALPQSQKNVLLDLVELTQARWLTRSFLEIAAAGFDRAIAYEFADRAEIGAYQNIGPYSESGRYLTSGMLFFDPAQPAANRFTKKASWYFVNTVKQMLTGYNFTGEVSYNNCNDAVSSSCPRIYKFTKAGAGDIWAMWLPTSNESVNSVAVNLGLPAGSNIQLIKLADGFPNGQPPITLSIGANGLLVVNNLSETPVFIKASSNGSGQNQTINFPAIVNKLVTDPPFAMPAPTGTSGLLVTSQIISGPATLSGNTISLTGQVGTVVVRATQAGNANWNPAAPVERSFTVLQVGQQGQTITFNTIPNKTTISPPFTVSAASSSGLPVSLHILSGPATILGNTVTLTGQVGTVVVRATQAGNTSWMPAATVDRSFMVSQASQQDQTIVFSTIPNKTPTSPPFTVSATASSGLPVSYEIVSGPATISGNTITLTGQMGTVVVRATQAGNASWNPAGPFDLSFTVSQAGQQNQTITFNTIPNKITNSPPFTVSAAASSGLPVFIQIVSGPATLSGNTITLTGQVGTVAIRATQVGNANWNPAAPVEHYFTVSQAGLQDQTIVFNTISNKTTSSPAFIIGATATSGLPVSFQIVSGPATISGNIVTLTGQVGNVTIRSTQAGNAQWNPAAAVDRTFTVTQQNGGGTIDLSLTVSNLPSNLTIYNNMDFTFTVTNSGTATATNVEVHVPTPSTVVFVGTNVATLSQGIYNWIGNRLWLVGSLAPGATATMTVHWFVLDTNQLMGWAQVSHADQTDTDSTPDNATAGIVSEDDETVKIIGTGQAPPVMQNQAITFGTLGNKLTTDPSFTLNATSSSSLAVSFSILSGPATISGNTVTLSGQPGSVNISATQAGNANYNPAPSENRTFQVMVPGSNGVDLKLAMTASAPNVTQFGHITFIATLTNEGTVAATGVKVHFPIPATAVLNGGNESVASKGSYAAYADQQWTVGAMAPGATETLELTFYVLQNVPLTGYAQVSAASPSDNDSTPNNGLPPTPIEDDEAAFTAGISNGGNGPDLELMVTSSSPSLPIWQDVIFTVTLNNAGNASVSGVKVAVPVPQGLAYTAHAQAPGTTYDLASNEWTVGTMSAGASKTISMTLFVLQNTMPLPYFVQVIAASNADVDSSPNNNSTGSPAEDDEAFVTLSLPSQQAMGIPGEVFSLFAAQNGATAKLRWSTNSGEHCLQYIVERSTNGYEWQVLVARDNDEQSDNFTTYLELDERPQPGWNFYRVVQLRDNGSLAFSNVQMLEFWEELDEFKLFPNPADLYVNVNLRSVEGQAVRLLLIDMMGRLVKEAWVEPATLDPYRLDIAEVHEGWYVLWIQVEGKRAKRLQLVVSKF